MKLVSVVVCTYNGEKFLKEQLDSIINQTYPLHEIIIRDDCSTDNTWNIIEEYRSIYPNIIKCFQNENNLGYGTNFKEGMYQAKGDYIVFSDQDDIWMPDKVEVLIKTIGNKLLVLSNSKIVDSEDNTRTTLFEESGILHNKIEKLIWNNNLYGHSCMISTDLLKYIKPIHVDTAHDYLIALICYSLDSVAITESQLQIWRRHNDAKTFTDTTNKKRYSGNYKIIYAIYRLITFQKSEIITDGFNKINLIISSLLCEPLVSKHQDDLIRLTRFMGKQTLLSYLKAVCLCWKLRFDMFDNKSTGIKDDILVLTFVFRWWFDHKHDMS